VRELTPDECQFFRDGLREARAAALRDSEASKAIIFAIERLGAFLYGKTAALGAYENDLTSLGLRSPLASHLPTQRRPFHTPLDVLLPLVREGRNSAMHEGSFGRHLTGHATELSLVLEDALMTQEARQETVGDFMVRSPLCAELWQPLSFVRHSLLANSFSYLPVKQAGNEGTTWKLVSDHAVARFLRASSGNSERKGRLSMTLGDAIGHDGVLLSTPYVCSADASVSAARPTCRTGYGILSDPVASANPGHLRHWG